MERNVEIPAHFRPAFCFSELGDAEWANLRRRARALAEVMGYIPPAAASVPGIAWYFSDPAFHLFGSKIDTEEYAPDDLVQRGPIGLIHSVNSESVPIWTVMERVRDEHISEWLVDKREGQGHDPRLLPKLDEQPTFREAVSLLSTTPATWSKFEGTSVAQALIK